MSVKKLKARLRKSFRLWKTRGRGRFCNLCAHQAGRFFPTGHKIAILQKLEVIGAGWRDNCLCPNCLSCDRDRLVGLWFQKHQELITAMDILHIAPDPNVVQSIKDLKPKNYLLGDKFAEGYQYSSDVVSLDLCQLPYPNAHFDGLICNHVLEHIPDDKKAMQEIHRVLKPGAWALLQVPFSPKLQNTIEDPYINNPTEQIERFGQRDHVRIYGDDYFLRLSAAGLQRERFAGFEKSEIQKFQLNPKEEIFFFRKV